MVVAEEIINTLSCSVGIGEVMKVKALIGELNAMYLGIAIDKICFQDESVFSQNVVDAPHMLSRIFIFSVVEGVAAVVRTKFLIPTSSQYMTAL